MTRVVEEASGKSATVMVMGDGNGGWRSLDVERCVSGERAMDGADSGKPCIVYVWTMDLILYRVPCMWVR